MKLWYQRLLYVTFFLVFLVATPLVALYTAGYRYNATKRIFEKTGILVVDSPPHRAEVYVNDRLMGTTPTRLTRLLPQTYRVRVALSGYSTWEQELAVKSNLTTFSKNVVLFKKTLPVLTTEGTLNLLTVAPNRTLLIYSLLKDDREEIWLRNLNSGTDFLVETLNRSTYNRLDFVAWSPSQHAALLRQVTGDFNTYLIINTETGQTRELFDVTRLSFDDIGWDQKNDELLYGLRKLVLYQINLATNTVSSIAAGHLDDFLVRGRDLYSITTLAKESFLNHMTLGSETAAEEKIKLPSPSSYTLQPAPDHLLALLDLKSNDLFVISTTAFASRAIDERIALQAKAKAIVWSNDWQKLLFYTDFEIWVYDLKRNQKIFINRLGKVIEEAFWYPERSYVIYRTDNTLRATETEEGSVKNDTELTSLSAISQPAVDRSGARLYFNGKVGNRQGLYQLMVQ